MGLQGIEPVHGASRVTRRIVPGLVRDAQYSADSSVSVVHTHPPVIRPTPMKRFLPLLLLFLAPAAMAQQGTIAFDRVIKIEINLPPEMESMRDQIPTENKTNMVLHFNEMESVWKAAEEQEDAGERSFGGGGMMIRMARAQEQNVTYINHDEARITAQLEHPGIGALGAADTVGLSPDDYGVSMPAEAADPVDAEKRQRELMTFEVALSAKVLTYVQDTVRGRIDPNKISG